MLNKRNPFSDKR